MMLAVATRDCWHCGVMTHMAPYGGAYIVPLDGGTIQQVWCPFRCDNCNGLSIAMGRRLSSQPAARIGPTAWLDQVAEPKWLPVHASGKDFPDVPEHISQAASEAYA